MARGDRPQERNRKVLQTKFLAAYRETASIMRAAEVAGISRRRHYDWIYQDPTYKERFADAQEGALLVLEEEMLRRGVEGVRRLKFYKGDPLIDPETGQPYVEHEYSDTLAIFMAKGIAPHKYRERTETTLQADITVNLNARMEQLQRVMDNVGNADPAETSRAVRRRAASNDSKSGDVRGDRE